MDRSTLRFLLFTYSLTWLLWLPALVNSFRGQALSPLVIGIGIPGMMVPSIVGLVFLHREHKSFRKMMQSVFRPKWSAWIGFALLFLPLLVTVAHIIHVQYMGGTMPRIEAPWSIPLAFLSTLLAGGPLFEEIGWRGYLQEKLLKRHSILATGLLVGVCWGIWHIPLFFIRGMFHEHIPLDQFAITVLLMSVIIAFVQVKAHAGLWPALLMHTYMNLTQEITPLFDEHGYTLWKITNGLLAVSVFALILVLGKRQIAKQEGVSK